MKAYLTLYPTDDGAIFNLACAYAQLFEKTKNKAYEQSAYDNLAEAIRMNPAWKQRARELTALGEGDLFVLRDQQKFKDLTAG